MIEIGKFGNTEIPQFSLLNDGFHPKGYVLMECRNSDMQAEGEGFFIDITTDMVIIENDKYHYSTLEMNKQELGEFIKFLQLRYDELP